MNSLGFFAYGRLFHILRKTKILLVAIILLSITWISQGEQQSLAAKLSTTTQLTLSSNSTTQGKSITLTATVTASGKPVSPGQVIFCDASAIYCADGAVLGTAQLQSNGTAKIKLLLGIGTHGLSATFKGTNAYAFSSSAAQTVDITGFYPSTTVISKAGGPGVYSLQAIVNVREGPRLTGTVSFLDLANNRSLGTQSISNLNTTCCLSSPSSYIAGYGPISIVTGDFNFDGIPDLATANFTDNTLSVLMGAPAHPGQFLPATNYPAGSEPNFVVAGDFNSDGLVDLALLSEDGDTLRVFINDFAHPGRFLSPVVYPVGYTPSGAAVGDFNQDGILDIAIANSNYASAGESSIGLMFGDSAHPGQFLSQTTLIDTDYPLSIAAGDFNGDGVLDLAVANLTSMGVFLGDLAHPGQFLSEVTYPTGNNGYLLSISDLNRDGMPDIAMTVIVGNSGGLEIFLNDPGHPGQFLSPQLILTNGLVYSVTSGDLNGDDIPDLIIGNYSRSQISVYPGDPSHPGQFSPAINYPAGGESMQVTVSDFDGDGLVDIAVANSGFESNTASILLGQRVQEATLKISNVALGPGSHYVAASYSGNSSYYGSGSCSILLEATAPSAPIISNIQVTHITATSATITWTTNVPTNGGVEYGLSTNFNLQTPWVQQISTNHSFTLTGLSPAAIYGYRVKAVSFFSGCTHWTTFAPAAMFTTGPPV